MSWSCSVATNSDVDTSKKGKYCLAMRAWGCLAQCRTFGRHKKSINPSPGKIYAGYALFNGPLLVEFEPNADAWETPSSLLLIA